MSGDNEQQMAELRAVTQIPITVVARFALTREGAEQLSTLLTNAVQAWAGFEASAETSPQE